MVVLGFLIVKVLEKLNKYMTKQAFKKQNLAKDGLVNKLLKIPNKKNVVIELNNIFASKSVSDISVNELQSICDKYKIKSFNKIKKSLIDFYKICLVYFLRDKKLSGDEYESLRQIKQLLDLSDKDTEKIFQELTSLTYKKTLSEFLKDGKFSKDEKEELDKIKKSLSLDKKIADSIYNEKINETYRKYFDDAVVDERLSPDEERELDRIAENLGINIKTDENTKKLLNKYKLFWNIENGNIPLVDIHINLQKNETCHFMKEGVGLHETRKVTKRINYGGPTMRIKIAKGLYYRAGSMGVQSVSEEVMAHIDSGSLFLTNKRIIFMGAKKNVTIRFNKVLDFECFKNGISIIKDAGKSPFFEFNDDIDLFVVTLSSLLKND